MDWYVRIFLIGFASCVMTACQTMDLADGQSGSAGRAGKIRVHDTLFYPDETGVTYIVPAGAKVVGAAGTNCRFVVENGGSVTAHTGNGNQYQVKAGGHFRGFAHAATNCAVHIEPGAVVEREQMGPGTAFHGVGGATTTPVPASAPAMPQQPNPAPVPSSPGIYQPVPAEALDRDLRKVDELTLPPSLTELGRIGT